MENYKKIGHIMSTHGLKGEVKIFLLTDSPLEFFKPEMEVFLKDATGSYLKKTVISYRPTPKNTCLVYLEGINSIDEAQKINKLDIYAPKKEIKGRIYLSDLIDMNVLSTKGKIIGQVSSVENISNKSYLKVNNQLLPYIPDVFISSVDMEKKEITLTEQGEDILLNA